MGGFNFIYPFICQLHHVAFDRLKSHTPFLGAASNVFLKFQCTFYCFNFPVTNTVISKRPAFKSMPTDMSFMYKENNNGLRTVPYGSPDTTGTQSDLTPFTTTLCCLKHKKAFIHSNFFQPIPYLNNLLFQNTSVNLTLFCPRLFPNHVLL